MSFFGSEVFFDAVRSVYCGGFGEVSFVGVDDFVLRVLVDRGEFVDGVIIQDWFDVADPGELCVSTFFNGRFDCGLVGLDDWFYGGLYRHFSPAPYLMFSSFNSRVRDVFKGSLSIDVDRKLKRAEREFGSVDFSFSVFDVGLLDYLFSVKSSQYLLSDFYDLFSLRKSRDLVLRLFDSGALQISVLNFDGIPVSVVAGVVYGGDYMYWFPCFDSRYSAFSPGSIHLSMLIDYCLINGFTGFDFMAGGESYKWGFATHVRCLRNSGGNGAPSNLGDFLHRADGFVSRFVSNS